MPIPSRSHRRRRGRPGRAEGAHGEAGSARRPGAAPRRRGGSCAPGAAVAVEQQAGLDEVLVELAEEAGRVLGAEQLPDGAGGGDGRGRGGGGGRLARGAHEGAVGPGPAAGAGAEARPRRAAGRGRQVGRVDVAAEVRVVCLAAAEEIGALKVVVVAAATRGALAAEAAGQG